tara:strand:+ start:668 stop:937 length:270 start_codon:yes stop_codon:yes gene_type:complete
MIHWVGDNSTFIMSISEPYHSGWYDVAIEIEGDVEDAKKGAQDVLKDAGFYRPHDNWEDWETTNTTYMKTQVQYHQIKVRRKDTGDEEE